MLKHMFSALIITLFAAMPLLPDQVIPPQNYGPPYLYPADPSARLYKLPWTAGKTIRTNDGYGSEPGGSHHPDYSVDFALVEGEPICATRAGRVSLVYGFDTVCRIPTSEGNKVMVLHLDSMPDSTMPSGWRRVAVKDLYLHINDDIPVKAGDWVEQGQVIAHASCTGQDGGSPHLHYKTFVDSLPGVWRHLGWFDFDTSYKFSSIPTPFVEITNRPNGLPEEGDSYTSQNTAPPAVENARPLSAPARLGVTAAPAGPRTVLELTLETSDPFQLDVLDLNGRLVWRHAGGRVGRRQCRVAWDGRSRAGLPAADAVYVAVLRQSGKHAARGFVKLR